MPGVSNLTAKATGAARRAFAKNAASKPIKKAVTVIAKDATTIGVKLAAPVESLVKLGQAAAGAGNKDVAQQSFVKAAAAAQGTLVGTDQGLAQVLQIAKIAHTTKGSGDAAKLVLTGAKDKFTGFAAKGQIAEVAHSLDQKAIHLGLMEQMASHAPTTADHVALADVLAKFAATEKGYKPLIQTTLQGGLARAKNLEEITAVQYGALRHNQSQIVADALEIGDMLLEQHHTGPGDFSQTVQDVLRKQGQGR